MLSSLTAYTKSSCLPANLGKSFKSNEGQGLKHCLDLRGSVQDCSAQDGVVRVVHPLPRRWCPPRVLFLTYGGGLTIRGNLAAQKSLGVPKAFALFESQGKEGTLPCWRDFCCPDGGSAACY